MRLDPRHPLARTADSRVISAYRGRRPEVTGVWFMRQAGRSLPEYRELRAGTRMLDACLAPGMAAELTLQPVRRHGVDAAIFFSDIVVPLCLAGLEVDIVPGTGPVLGSPVTSAADVAALPTIDPDAFAPVAEGVRRCVAELGQRPLIGFAGAPFTLASYLVAGGPSKDHLQARALMHSDPGTWGQLAAWVADVTGAFLRAQVVAGASAVQLFDSWAGSLSLTDYERFAAPASARALGHVRDLEAPDGAGVADAAGAPGTADFTDAGGGSSEPAVTRPSDVPGNARAADATGRADAAKRPPGHVPIVHFGVGTQPLLTAMRDVGADVIGVDYRTPLDKAVAALGGDVPVQGNIDPAMLAAPWPVLEAHVIDVIERGRQAPAHVVNLGHGVPPGTDPGVLTRIVDLVHGYGS